MAGGAQSTVRGRVERVPMITPLALQDYPHVRPLFHALDDHLAVAAILAGDVPAHVYADDPRHPQVALLVPWNHQRLYLAGTTENEAFNRAAAEVVAARYALRSPALAAFVVYPAPGDWEQRIAALVPDAATVNVPRQYFRLKQLQLAWRTLVGVWAWRTDRKLWHNQAARESPW